MSDTKMAMCWAFNKDGQRCQQLAGHDGNHAIAVEWDDNECYVPGQPVPIPQPPLWPPHGLEVVPTPHTGSGVCIICEHPHHPEGICGADDHGYDCDCANSVED